MKQFSSTHGIGDTCLFQPNLNKINAMAGMVTDPYSAIECIITDVRFTACKVYYGIEIRYQEDGVEFWLPVRDVMSDMICPLEIEADDAVKAIN